jgi:hypothetical protein
LRQTTRSGSIGVNEFRTAPEVRMPEIYAEMWRRYAAVWLMATLAVRMEG